MHSDAAYLIGHSHTVCQDYAFAASDHESVLALLADGCSGSPDTDIGARLLVRAALRHQPETLPEEGVALEAWVERAIQGTRTVADSLGLPANATDATLLGVCTGQGRFIAFAAGDGVIAVRRREGALDVYAISYGRGCPAYPSYRLDAGRQNAFTSLEGNTRAVKAFRLGGEGEPPALESRGELLWLAGDTSDCCSVTVLSDGAQSYRIPAEKGEEVALLEVLGHLLGFKAMRGTFAQRRLTRFEKESCEWGWRHHDDVSLAVVAFDGE